MTQYLIAGEAIGARAQQSPYSIVAGLGLGVGQVVDLTLSTQDETTLLSAGILQFPGALASAPLLPSGADDTASINAAIVAGQSLGVGTFSVNAALLVPANGRLLGAGGRAKTIIKANPAGNFTNGPLNAARFMVKWNGGDAWAHGVRVTGIKFDTSGVVGLGAMWFQEPGENSWFDDLRCDSCVATSRTVTDAQITSGSNVVTFTASTVTEDDVNALVTHANFPANTKIDRINWANDQAYPPQTTALSVTLNNAATGNATDASVVINQPTDAFVFERGAATGRFGMLNGILNSGAVLRLRNQISGTWSGDSLTGDSNGGGLLRVSRAANAGDPMSVTIGQVKAENTQAGATVAMMDPVILLDRCDMLALTINGGTVKGGPVGASPRDVIRVDSPVINGSRGGPSIKTIGIDGNDPFNLAYTNILHDTSTGKARATTPTVPSGGQTFYPDINWNREIDASQGRVTAPGINPWFAARPISQVTDGVDNAATWQTLYDGNALGTRFTFNGTNAQNDGGRWRVTLPAGTWTLLAITKTGTDGAVATVDISYDHGSTWTTIGTVDTYAASAAAKISTFTGIAVSAADYALVRFRALTRNASNTTGWFMRLTGMEWTRTS